jgi:hypothetical protein
MIGHAEFSAAAALMGAGMKCFAQAGSVLGGGPVPALIISTTPGQANPYGSYDESKHGKLDAPSAADAATCGQLCKRPAGHHGVHIDAGGHEFGYVPNDTDPWGDDTGPQPGAHLHVHRGGNPECTFKDCTQGTPGGAS